MQGGEGRYWTWQDPIACSLNGVCSKVLQRRMRQAGEKD